MNMNYYALGPTIVAAFVLILGFFVLLKNRKNKLNLIYFYLSISLFAWLISFSLMYWSFGKYDLAYFFAKIGFIGVILTPVCILHFTVEFLNSSLKRYTPFFYLLTIPVICINFLSPHMYSGLSENFWGYYPIAGKLYFIALFEFVGTFLVATIVLFRHFRKENTDIVKREQIKYLMMAFAIALFASGDYIIKYPAINFYPFGYIVVIFFSFIMALNAVKNNLMDIRLVITNGTILIFLYIFVLGIPIYLGLYTHQWFVSFVLLFVFSTLAPLIFRFLQRKAELILLAEQERYQQLLMQASKGMIEKEYDISKLSQLIVRIIKRSVKINFVSLFIINEEKNIYDNLASRGENGDLEPLQEVSKNNKIIAFMESYKKPFFFSDLQEELKNEFLKISKNINIIVPSIFRDEVIGFLILGEKENKTLYSKKDIEIFGTLSNQAALAVENCMFLEKSQKQQKRLFEADKLASIGGMADGMAHQIRNRLNSFGLAAELLSYDVQDFSTDYKEFIEKNSGIKNMITNMNELIHSINENVKKTNTVLTGILNFAKPKGSVTEKETFSLREILAPSIMLVQVKHHKEKVPIVLDIFDDDRIYGIKYQIQEVCFNCIDNAFEAIMEKEQHIQNPLFNDVDKKEPFVPEIKVSLRYLIERNRYQIIIKDNGIGIKPENKAKIFSAFFTTKPSSKSGSGIGSYVARRMIVEAHNGDISFESRYGEGTTFTITLPLSSKKDKEVQE